MFFGRFVSTPTPDAYLIQHGAILVDRNDGHGVIAKCVWDDSLDAEQLDKVCARLGVEVEDIRLVKCNENGFFFPGFIDTHIHASQYPNSGIFGKSTLLDWLTTYTFPLEASLKADPEVVATNGNTVNGTNREDVEQVVKKQKTDPLARARLVYDKVISRTLSYGTTTASYFATLDVEATNLLADLAFMKGQRAYIGRVCMDHPETCPEYYRDEGPDETVQKAVANIEYCQQVDPSGELVAPIVTPRFAPSLHFESLCRLGKLAQERDLRVQTHISENVGEVAWVKELFPECESYTAVYEKSGLLGSKTILAHGIHLDDTELDMIRSRGSKISHCPSSNSALGSGFCQVRRLLEKGIDVGLGTDVSGGYSCSTLDAVRQACLVSRQLGYVKGGDKKWNIGVAEGLWLGTVGGASCVGMAGKLGGFEKGMIFDVQEIELGVAGSQNSGPVDIFGWEKLEDRVDKWVWNGDDRNVSRVWVGGRLVHERK